MQPLTNKQKITLSRGPEYACAFRTVCVRVLCVCVYYFEPPIGVYTYAVVCMFSWWLHTRQPFKAYCCHMGTAIKHPVPDRVKRSFVIFDALTLWRSVQCPDVKNYKWRLNPVWHRMLYSCTHMATVGFKGLSFCLLTVGQLWRRFALCGCSSSVI